MSHPVRKRDGRPTAGAASAERGAAVVEFVMVSVLLVLLLFGVLQVAVFVYARNVVSSAVSDAARYAATGDPGAGAGRAHDLIASGLGHRTADALRCTSGADVDAGSGLPTARVRCTGHVGRVLGVFGLLPLGVDVGSSALREGAP